MATEAVDRSLASSDSNRAKSTGLVVLGMHRSGTSLAASLMNGLGFHYAGEPLPPQPDNPRGYFEDRRIVEAHDRFLMECGRSWSDPRPIPNQYFSSRAAKEARRHLSALMETDFLSHDTWVLKDPRICRLFPLWNDWFDEHQDGMKVGFVHVYRSPRAVAASLLRRDRLHYRKSAHLWLRHCLESELCTRGRDRTWIRFEKLTGDEQGFESALSRLSSLDQVALDQLPELQEEYYSSDLVHSGADVHPEDELWEHPWLLRIERAFDRLSAEESSAALDDLDALREELELADRILVGYRPGWEAEVAEESLGVVSRRLEQTNHQIAHLGNLMERSLGVAVDTPHGTVTPEDPLAPTEEDDRSDSPELLEVLALARRLEGELAVSSTRWQTAVEELARVRSRVQRSDLDRHEAVRELDRAEEKREGAEATLDQERERARRMRLELEARLSAAEEALARADVERKTAQEDLALQSQRVREVAQEANDNAERLAAERVAAMEEEVAERVELVERELSIVTNSASWRATRWLRTLRSWIGG